MDRQDALAREIKAMPASLAGVGDDGLFEGYACLFGKEDLGRDIVRKGAFAASLARHRQGRGQGPAPGTGPGTVLGIGPGIGKSSIKMLYQHDPAEPIGQWLEIREDTKGLYVRGKLALEIARAREVFAMMKSGILDGLSIGFRTIRGQTDPKSGLRQLMEVDLWEISVVTFPMQPGARIASVKTGFPTQSAQLTPAVSFDAAAHSKRQLERKLMQDAGLTRSEARALLAHGHKGLVGRQDAVAKGPGTSLAHLHRLTRSIRQATLSVKPTRIN